MEFMWPNLLYLLLLVPVLIGLYLLYQRRRRKIRANYGSFGNNTSEGGDQRETRRHIPAILFLLGISILMVTLARPQMVISLPRQEGTVILAFDVSGSMAANDIKPSRMEAAKTAAHDFVQHQPVTIQIGVVAFSDSGFSVQLPTNDKDAINAAIDRLAPQRGTSLAGGILTSLKTITSNTEEEPHLYSNLPASPTPTPTPIPKGTYAPAVIILLTDGENNENPDPATAAQTAAERGVRIDTIGLGSAAGTILHVNGITVHTQLNEAMLKNIADVSDGTYYNASNADELRKVYDNLEPVLAVKPEKTEITALLAGAGLVVLLAGAALSFIWFNRLP